MGEPSGGPDATGAPRVGRAVTWSAAATLALIAGGFWFYRVQEAALRQEIEERLAAIAQVNSERVAQWRRDQWLDAALLAENPFLGDGLTRLWNNPDNELADDIDNYLRRVQREHDYADILIVDPDGRVRHSLEQQTELSPFFAAAVEQAMLLKERVFVDELGMMNGGAPFATVAPLYTPDDDGADAQPSGVLILVNDVMRHLFPLIESWPTASESGETLLVRRVQRGVGEAVVLNKAISEQPEGADAPQAAVAASTAGVTADLAQHGVVECLDYRGARVLAAITPVPNSDWLVVSKQNHDEAFALWHIRSTLILALLGAAFITFGAIGFVFWHRGRRKYFEERYRREAQRRASAERFGVILGSIGDGVIVTDEAGNVDFLNGVAETLTGWSSAEARGKPLRDVFHIYNGETRAEAENPVERVMREGAVIGLANDTWLISRDGPERPIADSGAPVRDASGELIGVVLVFQDQTEQYRARKELMASEERHRLLIESAPDAIFVQVDGCFAYLNPACLKLLGATNAESLLGSSVLERFHPSYHETIRARIRKLNDERKPVALVEEELISLSGEVVPAEVSAMPIEFEGKHGALVFVRDIRVRKHAETALKQNLAMLERTERIAQVGSWEWDIMHDDVRWSTELYRIFGMNPAEPPPPFSEHSKLYPRDGYERMRQAVTLCTETGAPYELELQIIRTDGSIRWCVAHGEAERDSEGRIHRLVGSLQDITERKRAEEDLRRSEEKFRSLFVNHAAVKLLIDPKAGAILDANEAAAAFYGWTVDELRGMTMAQINTRSPAELESEMEAARPSKKTYFESQHRKADGSVADVEMFSSNIVIDGQNVLHTVVHDISEKRRIEGELLQAQKMESIGQLAGGVAHDFNNMLGVILGNAELAMHDLDPDTPLYSDLDNIVTAANRSTDIARQLLAFARKQTIHPVVLDLNETVSGMLKMLRRLIGENIDLIWSPGHELWPVLMDPVQIDQILVNLCVNARDAINDVGRIIIETHNVSLDETYCDEHHGFSPGDFVVLTVSDDGAGMDKETRERIFEPFFTTKDVGKGTGLGLSTVYGIVKQNDGFVHVYSEPDQGTTFRIYFARQKAHSVEPAAEEAPDSLVGKGETILIVEDEIAILSLAERMLEKLDYHVLTAATPEEALQIAREHENQIHLLITDMVMPGMNGRDLAESLTKQYPGLRVLFMSGYTADAIARRGVLDGSAMFVQKPFTQKMLATKVREVFDSTKPAVTRKD